MLVILLLLLLEDKSDLYTRLEEEQRVSCTVDVSSADSSRRKKLGVRALQKSLQPCFFP
jgi:hypothetical protein